jgi:hypothetical protein
MTSGLRQIDVLGGGFGQPLDDRRKIGARIGEDVIDAERFQAGEDRAACRDVT